MPEENTITTIFRADISQFSSSTQQLNQYVKTVNSEFNLATASMGKWSDSTDGLQAKITQLNKTLEAEKMKLSNLESALADLQKEGKGNTKQANNLQIAINNQRATIAKTERAVEGYEDSLKELKDAGVKTRQELDKLNQENEELKANAKELGGNLLKGFAVGIAGIGTACVGALKGLSNLINNTAELRLEQGRIQTAFESSGFSAEEAMNQYNEFNAVLGDTKKTNETLMQLAMFSKNTQELTTYTDILTGVYAKLGDSLPTESLAEGINHTIQLGEVQGSLADALEWAGISVEDFNEELAKCNSEEERSQLIQTRLTDIYGEASKQYKENNKDVIEATRAQNEYNNKMAEIATKVQPVMTEFKLAMVDVLQKILEKFEEVDIGGIIAKIAEAMVNTINWFIEHKDIVIAGILGIGSAFLAWKVANVIQTATTAMKALTLATQGQTIAQRLLNIVMKANPIGLVATAIGGLVTAFTILWNKSEGFRNFFLDMWERIKKVAGDAVGFVVKLLNGDLAGAFKSLINSFIGGFEFALNAIIGLLNGITTGLSSLWTWTGIPAIPKIPQVNLPRLAKGAVIDQPTLAMIGEAGKEAVVPLENNTQWINELADKLSNKIGNQNVVNNYTIENKFERMETSQLALHKANLELKKIIGG